LSAVHKYYVAWNAVALSAATAKTILELPTNSTTEIELCELYLGFDTTTAGNCKVEFGTFTTTGTGTAATPQKFTYQSQPSGISAAKVADTVEPTGFSQGTLGGTMYPGMLIPLPLYLPFQWPLDEGLTVPISINFAIRLTASVATNVMGWVAWKE
jgi:hypothetical protein